MATSFERHLGPALAAHLRGGNRQAAYRALREKLDADPALKAEAVAKKAALDALANSPGMNGQLHRRCAVSAIHLTALRSALD